MSSNPICTIIAWYGNPLRRPLGYEYCNGGIIDIVTFPELYGYLVSANPALYISPTQASLPDLRGEFLRGWDDVRGVDKERRIGSFQHDGFGSHNHDSSPDRVGSADGWKGGWSTVDGTHPVLKTEGGFTAFRVSEAGIHETKPRNVAVSFLIKSTKNGEERPLGEFLAKLPDNYPDEIRVVLTELAQKIDPKVKPRRQNKQSKKGAK